MFKNHVAAFPDKELLPLFNEWADQQSLYGIERHEVWRRVRHVRGRKTVVIKENSEEEVRLKAVLDILLEADLKVLHKLMEKEKGVSH